MQRVRFKFCAAHRLPGHPGACAELHGHTWRGTVTVSAPVSEVTSMATDFLTLKKIIDTILPDHSYLNDLNLEASPTCEAIADYLWKSLSCAMPPGVEVVELELWESDRCGVQLTA